MGIHSSVLIGVEFEHELPFECADSTVPVDSMHF